MSDRPFTEEQESITLSILNRPKHEFYELLQVEKGASDNEIKKAYRKLAIRLHPDKNTHPRASEAFKRINRAFEVLSDVGKRRMFDQLGRDPDDRAAAQESYSSGTTSAGAASGFNAGFPPQGMFFRGGGPPEDIFDFLFNAHAAGGNPFGSPFGGPFGGGSTTFTFGGPNGFKMYTNNSGRGGPGRADPRRRAYQRQQQEEDNQQMQQIARILIPILFILILPMLEKFLFGA